VSVYETYVLPRLIHWGMRKKIATAERKRFIPLASGTVLEVGIGSGLNLPFYGPQVQKLYALDPSRALWNMARPRVREAPFPVEFLAASAERIPLEDMSVDTVVTTWTLCTIPDLLQALTDMRRVLKPEGRLIFVEHGHSPDPSVLAWQNRLTPVWKRIGGGCHLNRQIDALIADAGFDITQIDRGYSRGPKPMTYLYKGVARRAA
jgi:ubiquinone/menaquinone biosynthesis C-methylase UbiE